MLEDRDYMRGGGGRRIMDPGHSGLKCLFTLIFVNVLAYILISPEMPLKGELCLSPWAMRDMDVWQPVTAIFMHASFGHLLFNMLGLYMFGMLSAPVMGSTRFLSLFLFSGVLGNLLWLAVNWNTPALLLGASGSVMGVVMATAMLFPDGEGYLLFIPFPMKLKTMAMVFVGLDIFLQMTNPPIGANVAYLAHVGGFFGGYLFMKLAMPRDVQWDILKSIGWLFRKRPPKGWTVQTYDRFRKGGTVSRGELDRILDKISVSGINSLSEEEQERLRQAREHMKGQ